MFSRKVFFILVLFVILMGVFVKPSTARESKVIPRHLSVKQVSSIHAVCASGCDFSSIQVAIDNASVGDTLSLMESTEFDPVWSPDGTAIYFWTRDTVTGDYEINLYNLENQEVTMLIKSVDGVFTPLVT